MIYLVISDMHGAKRYHVGACRVEIDFVFRPPKSLSRQDSETATATGLAGMAPNENQESVFRG